MKVQIDIEVTDCRDCLFRSSFRGHGECWEECSHKESGKGAYENILWGCQEEFKEVPEWCPLGLNNSMR